MDFLDPYNIRARLFPAILAIAPGLAFITLGMHWDKLGLSQAISTVAVGVLFFGFSDLSRRFGKRTEKTLFRTSGGRPNAVLLLRHSNTDINAKTRSRYREFLAGKIGEPPPGADDEVQNPGDADAFYERAGFWLREHTRDKEQFKVLFEENITYGFRRNLYGLKWPALLLNVSVVAICLVVMHEQEALTFEGVFNSRFFPVLVIAAIHALYFLTVVSARAVLAASDQYARQLLSSCELLIQGERV